MKTVYLIMFLFIGLPKEAAANLDLPMKPIDKSTSKNYQKVDLLMEEFLDKTKVAGVSISVNQSGEMIYSKGFGFADVEQNIKMQATHQIRTASIAKVITATALGKLVSDGKLNLDAPLKDYLPYIQAPYANLTARQLAGHTAGVPHRPSSKKIKRKHYTEVRDMVDFFKNDPLLFEPDTDYKYSTLGYNLLAALIEELSGKIYVDYMKEDIFGPLKMTQTFPDKKGYFTEADAKLYYLKNGELKLDEKIQDGSYKLPGAGFRSTSLDLAKMMNAYFNGFISAEVVETMFENNRLKSGAHTNVGIGWRLNKDINNRRTIEHAGSWQGARTVIVYYPENQLSVSIMINTKCTTFIEETAQLIAQLFLEGESPNKNLMGVNKSIEIKSNLSNGDVATYNGQLRFLDNTKGKLFIETDRVWLKENNVYYLSSNNNFVLSTQYGFLYLKLSLEPKLEGELFQYQVLSDQYHMNQKPMLSFYFKN